MPSSDTPSSPAPSIDPDRLQHESEYRRGVIRQVTDRMIEKAEAAGLDTTYEQLASDHPDLIPEEISDHVEAKIESSVEQAITKKRLRRGKIRGKAHESPRADLGRLQRSKVGHVVSGVNG